MGVVLAGWVMPAARAVEGCQDLPARGREDIPALASQGLQLSRAQRYREAADCYRKALAIDPKLGAAQLNLGLAEFKMGDFRAAVAPLRAALAIDPASMQARALLGMSYYGAGDFAQAAVELEPVLAAQPANPQLHYVLAQSCLWSGKYGRALEEFQWLLKEHPSSAATHMLMAEALDGEGKENEAIAELRAAAAGSPPEPDAHFGLGYLYWKQKQYDEAGREFRAELAQDSSHARAAAYLGDVLLHGGDTQAAEHWLEQARRLNPKVRIARLDLGIVYADRNQNQQALEELREAVKLDPSRPDAHYRLARVYRSMGRTGEERAELAVVKQLHADTIEDMLHKVSGRAPGMDVPEN